MNSSFAQTQKLRTAYESKQTIMWHDGKEVPTKHMVLFFQLHKLPSAIKTRYLHCHVCPYIPNPQRCFKRYCSGHGSQVCSGQASCRSVRGHKTFVQKWSKMCPLQGGPPRLLKTCPRWKEEKQILKIKENRIQPAVKLTKKRHFLQNGAHSSDTGLRLVLNLHSTLPSTMRKTLWVLLW